MRQSIVDYSQKFWFIRPNQKWEEHRREIKLRTNGVVTVTSEKLNVIRPNQFKAVLSMLVLKQAKRCLLHTQKTCRLHANTQSQRRCLNKAAKSFTLLDLIKPNRPCESGGQSRHLPFIQMKIISYPTSSHRPEFCRGGEDEGMKEASGSPSQSFLAWPWKAASQSHHFTFIHFVFFHQLRSELHLGLKMPKYSKASSYFPIQRWKVNHGPTTVRH